MFLLTMSANLYINISMHIGLYALTLMSCNIVTIVLVNIVRYHLSNDITTTMLSSSHRSWSSSSGEISSVSKIVKEKLFEFMESNNELIDNLLGIKDYIKSSTTR